MPRVRTLVTACALAIAAIAPAQAQNWPVKPVTMVVGFAAGGGTDILGRTLAKRMSEILGQQVNVDNVAGAGGMVGSARVAKSSPDGYQFVLGSRADTINQALYKKPLYDLRAELVPVILVADQPTVLIARKELPVANLREFVAHVRANQKTMQFASAGHGSTGYIDCALLNQAMGVNVTHVPYRGGNPALQDIMAGRVDYICTLSASAVPLVESARVKAVAVLTPERAPMLPDLPSAKEQGIPEMDASTWYGFFVPKGTPEPVIERLHQVSSAAMDTPEVQAQLLKAGAIVFPASRRPREYFRGFLEREIEKNGATIRASGIQVD